MESQYIDKDVDLSLVSSGVEKFFRKKGFRTVNKITINGFSVICKPAHSHEILGPITITITGDPRDFTIKFISGSRSEAYVKFGRLTSLFGGGVLFLRGLKSQENEGELERSFWRNIEAHINAIQTQH